MTGLVRIADFVPEIGMKVKTNGTDDSNPINRYFTGTIVDVSDLSFCIMRDDKKEGSGVLHDGLCTWCVDRRCNGLITVISKNLRCGECGELDYVLHEAEGVQVCSNCAKAHGFGKCLNCGPFVKINQYGICFECFQTMGVCDCGDIVKRDTMANHKGKLICRNCADKLKRITSLVASDSEVSEMTKILETTSPKTLLRTNTYNPDDELFDIVAKIGKVKNPIYIYGLLDRHEYGMAISPDLAKDIPLACDFKENVVIDTPSGFVNIIKTSRLRSIGISKDLRVNHQEWVVDLIKGITC